MKDTRKLVAILLALVLALGLLPTAAFAADSDFVIENGVLTKYKGPSGDVVIPDGVTSIREHAFASCTGLTSVTIPDSVTDIGDEAFYGCTSLASITIPDSVTSIGWGSFSGCTSLAGVTIPDSVTDIGNYAFCNCAGLTNVTIPDRVTSIGGGAFCGCTGLTEIRVFPENPNFTSADGVLFDKSKTALLCFPGGKDTTQYTIPSGVTNIGEAAFHGCPGLTGVTIPDSVTSIGQQAFRHCTGLIDITIPDSVTQIEYAVFYGCTGLTSITIPDSVTSIKYFAFNGCTALTHITIPGSVTTIESSTFGGCTGLTSVTIPDSVTAIGGNAFFGCTGLTHITIGNGVTRIENSAFSGCTGLTDVYYVGTEGQWSAISVYPGNDPLQDAVIHYGSTGPAVPVIVSTGIDPQPTGIAKESTQPVNIGGKQVTIQAYALMEGGGSTNYVKIRDVAAALDGTASQFDVTWDGAVNLITGTPYASRNGQENQTPYSGDRPYTKSTAVTKVNGVAVPLQAFVLLDDNGNGSTYYKLRDLGQALGFNVGWSAEKGIYIEPGVPYDPSN